MIPEWLQNTDWQLSGKILTLEVPCQYFIEIHKCSESYYEWYIYDSNNEQSGWGAAVTEYEAQLASVACLGLQRGWFILNVLNDKFILGWDERVNGA